MSKVYITREGRYDLSSKFYLIQMKNKQTKWLHHNDDMRTLNEISNERQGGHLTQELRSPRKLVDLDRIYEALYHVRIDL